MMVKGKKAVLISISLLIICLAILSYAVIQSDYRKNIVRESTEMSAIDRANSIVSGVQTSVRKIVSMSGGVNISVNGMSAVFKETLGSGASNFDEQLSRYKRFLETFTDKTNLTIGNSGGLILNILPANIAYTHPSGTGGQTIKLVAGSSNYSQYDIDAFVPGGKLIDLAKCAASITPGTKKLDIIIIDALDRSCEYSGTFDPASAGYVTANTTTNEKISVTIPAGTYGDVIIEDINKIGVAVTTNVTLLISSWTRPAVVMPGANITVNLSAYGVTDIESVMVA